MSSVCIWIRVVVLLSAVLAAGVQANGAIVAMKDYATVATGGSLDTAFSNAIANATVAVYTGATADTQLSQYTGSASGAFWYNYGTATQSVYIGSTSGTPLIRFDLSLMPGFGPGAVINKAELRLRDVGGNTGNFGTLSYVVTQNWSEGNKTGGYPGAAPAAAGASRAHPKGLNSTANRKADNSPGTASSGSWGVNGDTQWNEAVDSAVVPNLVNKGIDANKFRVWTVTDIVNSWAQGTVANRGFCLPGTTTNNHSVYFSEYGATNANYEPVLFIDYTPAPEPVSLALLALSLPLAAWRRRR